MVDSSSSNPLPADAEHSPAPTIPSGATESNPLPDHAEHTPVVKPVDASNVNPIAGTVPSPKSVPASNDSLVQAVGYLPAGGFQFIAAIIGLIGQNARAKFHGAQALLYWFLAVFFMMLGAIVVLPMMAMALGLIGVMISGLLSLAYVVLVIFAVPGFLFYKTWKGHDVMLPLIGKFIADKVGYKP